MPPLTRAQTKGTAATPSQPVYRTTTKTKRIISTAQSFKYNPRNLENSWHPVYGQVLHDLVDIYENIFVHIQYLQWRADEGIYAEITHENNDVHSDNVSDLEDVSADEQEREQQVNLLGSQPEHHPVRDSPSYHAVERRRRATGSGSATKSHADISDPEDDDPNGEELEGQGENDFDPELETESDEDEGEDSEVEKEPDPQLLASTSSNKTIVGPKDDEFPDLALMHQVIQELRARGTGKKAEDAEVIRTKKRFGMQTTHLCPAVLGEMKTNVSRTKQYKFLTTRQKAQNDAAINKKLIDAQGQMAGYLDTFFKRYPCLDEVVALVMAGPYWRYRIFARDAFLSLQWDSKRNRFKENRGENWRKYTRIYGDKFFELGTDASDRALNKFRTDCLQHLSSTE